jgi:aspartate racemase
MKTIGLIGGMSWESSLEYYKFLNQEVKARLGEPHSSELIMYSVDFAEFERLQHEDEWDKLTEKMINIAMKLEKAGAEIILICTNTMHIMAEEIQNRINGHLLHIADATAEAIKAKKLNKVGLLGTKFTMKGDFYKKRLQEKHNIDVIIPEKEEMDTVHQVIYQELISGVIKDESREKFKSIIDNLALRGAEGVILGCTEIPLLIKNNDSKIPVFDTSMVHAKKAVKMALE